MGLAEVVKLFLEHRDHLRVARATCAPAGEDAVPRDGLLEVPAFGLRVELTREGIVELPDLLAVAGLLVRWDVDADLFAIGDDGREPPLSQLVVGQSFEAVLELRRVHFLVVGESKPLYAKREHPVDGALQLFFRAAPRGAGPLHPVAAVSPVES